MASSLVIESLELLASSLLVESLLAVAPLSVFEKKLGTEAIFNYYDDLIDEWHTSTKDIGGLREYLGLDEEMYTLFLLDTKEFIRALDNKYFDFKIDEHNSKVESNGIKSPLSLSHEHCHDLRNAKGAPLYGRFVSSLDTKKK